MHACLCRGNLPAGRTTIVELYVDHLHTIRELPRSVERALAIIGRYGVQKLLASIHLHSLLDDRTVKAPGGLRLNAYLNRPKRESELVKLSRMQSTDKYMSMYIS